MPQGLSLRARILIVELAPGDIGIEALTHCQLDARAGLFAEALAACLWWLSPRFEAVAESLTAEVEALREQVQGNHARTPEVVAHLGVGLRRFLEFAQASGAISQEEGAERWERGWTALCVAGSRQTAYLTANEPARRYLELLGAALASGRAHVADLRGNEPENPCAWGWRSTTIGIGEQEWRPQGERIGWVNDDDLYLVPDAAYNVAKRMGGDDGISIGLKTLHKRLKEQGHLKTVDATHGTLTVRRTAEDARHDVLHLHASLLSEKPTQSPQPTPFNRASSASASEKTWQQPSSGEIGEVFPSHALLHHEYHDERHDEPQPVPPYLNGHSPWPGANPNYEVTEI